MHEVGELEGGAALLGLVEYKLQFIRVRFHQPVHGGDGRTILVVIVVVVGFEAFEVCVYEFVWISCLCCFVLGVRLLRWCLCCCVLDLRLLRFEFMNWCGEVVCGVVCWILGFKAFEVCVYELVVLFMLSCVGF